METINISLYNFNELCEDSQKVAIRNQIEFNYQNIYLDFLIDEFKEIAENEGFINPKFQYSLTNSQGDGLSFSFDYFDSEKLRELIKKFTNKNANWFLDSIQNSIFSIKGKGNTGHYCFALHEQIELLADFGNYRSWNFYTNISQIQDKILSRIQNNYMNLCHDFEKTAYKEIEYQTSKEFAKETLINGPQFLKSGLIPNF